MLLFHSKFFNKNVEIIYVVFLKIYVWIQCTTGFIYQYNLKAVIQGEMTIKDDKVPLMSLRRSMPFPQVVPHERSPCQQFQQEEAAGPRVRRWGWNCVWVRPALSWREETSFPVCVQRQAAWAGCSLRRWYLSSYWFWKPDNYLVTNSPRSLGKVRRGKHFFLRISNYIGCIGNSHLFFFLILPSDFGGFYVGYRYRHIRIFHILIS